MTLFHAVVWIDHHEARVLQFDAEHVQASRVKARSHHTRQHHSGVRSEHEFFGHVCDAMVGISEVLMVGSRTALADMRHYIEKHRSATGRQVVGWETVDHPTEPQLVAFARQYFLKYDRMAGTPTPS